MSTPDDIRRAWWDEQCSERAAGLSHAHWNKCEAVHPHDGTPMSGRTHLRNMCCHCEFTYEMMEEMRDAMRLDGLLPVPPPPVGDLPLDDLPLGECNMKHEAIQSKFRVAEGGGTWAVCVLCGVTVEPKLATGKVDGYPHGKGRGELTEKQTAQLHAIAMNDDFNAWLDAGRPDLDGWFDRP